MRPSNNKFMMQRKNNLLLFGSKVHKSHLILHLTFQKRLILQFKVSNVNGFVTVLFWFYKTIFFQGSFQLLCSINSKLYSIANAKGVSFIRARA